MVGPALAAQGGVRRRGVPLAFAWRGPGVGDLGGPTFNTRTRALACTFV
jgi:hypothetical protein